ncbi:MAG TPA: hypothetical protein ENN24_07315 [Bacteroidetes bacterium]|nr:hypothetical protein [Bacteroidota bacterium]
MRNFCLLALAIITIFAPSGCKKDDTGKNQKDIQIIPLDVQTVAQLPMALYESSGIIVSSPNRVWSHNDSGNSNELFLFDTTGTILRTLTIVNATNIDWEDLAIDTQGRVYINDAGNNNNNRRDLKIYRIPNLNSISGDGVLAEVISFEFEDQTLFPPPSTYRNFCIEAIVWKDGFIFMFTKDRSSPITGYTKMYRVPDEPGDYTAQLIDSFYVDNQNHPARVTAADINLQTGELVLLTRTRVLSFKNYPGNIFFKGNVIDYQFTSLIGQAEAIAFINENELYITSEGAIGTPGNLYKVKLFNQ